MKKHCFVIILIALLVVFSGCNTVSDDIFSTCEFTCEESTDYELFTDENSTDKAESETTVLSETTFTLETTTENTLSTTTVKTTEKVVTTTQVSTTQVATEKSNYCYVSIICNTINNNIDDLKSSKKSFVPSDGVIIENVAVSIKDGENVFDIIKRACSENTCKENCKYCKQNGIQIEYTYTPAFNNYYIEGIHQLYEKDCGMQSGWMYSVNGLFPNVGASSYPVKSGDTIVFAYTCNMGEDIGNIY